MEGWLNIIVSALLFNLGFWLYMTIKQIVTINQEVKQDYEQTFHNLFLFRGNDEAKQQINSLEVKDAEIVQPVSEPTPADLVIQTVKENKW